MAQDKNYISVTMLGRFLSRLRQIFAPFNHTHLYAGSNSAGGAANSAVKLQTPRTINGINFDGTNNINVPAQSINPTYLANQNLNYMIQLGFYYGVAGNNCTNLPSGVDAFSLEVYRTDNNNIAQKLLSGNNTSERIYFRQRTGSEWSEWGHVYTSKYKPTPSDIGAASSSHTHYYSEIYNTPTSMKNPYALTLNVNGSNLIYDGSANKSANINPGTIGAAYSTHGHSNATQSLNGFMSYNDKKKLDGISENANYTIVDSSLDYYSTNAIQNKAVYNALSGKANTSHSHSYAGSSSAGGAATSANKLTTSRRIGNAYFDGTQDISLSSIGAANQATVNSLQTSVNEVKEGKILARNVILDPMKWVNSPTEIFPYKYVYQNSAIGADDIFYIKFTDDTTYAAMQSTVITKDDTGAGNITFLAKKKPTTNIVIYEIRYYNSFGVSYPENKYLLLTGGKINGDLSVTGKITCSMTPSSLTDLVNKQYVDNKVSTINNTTSSLQTQITSANNNITKLNNDLEIVWFAQKDLNTFKPTGKIAACYGWGMINCPYAVGVVVVWIPYGTGFGVQLCYTVEKVDGFFRQARRIYTNDAWDVWELDGNSMIKYRDYNINITASNWTKSAAGQYYYNHQINYGIVGTVISTQILFWIETATLVDCSFYENNYIQLRASSATAFNGTIRVVYI